MRIEQHRGRARPYKPSGSGSNGALTESIRTVLRAAVSPWRQLVQFHPDAGRHRPAIARDTGQAMSGRDEEIIERLRRGYEAFNRRDFDAAMEMADPEIEFVLPGRQSSLRGAEAVRAWMEPDAFEQQHIEPLEFSIQDNKVLVRQRVRARGAGSGIELEFEIWALWTLNDDGLATRVESYLPHQETEALEAAGLSE